MFTDTTDTRSPEKKSPNVKSERANYDPTQHFVSYGGVHGLMSQFLYYKTKNNLHKVLPDSTLYNTDVPHLFGKM